MEENVQTVVPVNIIPKKVYGLRKEVIGNIKVTANDEIVYPVEEVLVVQDIKTRKQRFLRFPEKTIPSVIAINSTRRLLAIVEITTSGNIETNIAVYDAVTLKKRRNFYLPNVGGKKKITRLSFIYDSRGLIALTNPPNEMLYMMLFDKNGAIIEGAIGTPHQRVTATCIAGNPQDVNLVAVCGDGMIKFMSKTESGFITNSTIKTHYSVVTIAWLSMDMLLLGLKKAKLIVVENGEIKLHFDATEVEILDVSKEQDVNTEEADQQRTSTEVQQALTVPKSTEEVKSVTVYSKFFAYSVGNKVYFFEKISKYVYQRMKIITLEKTIYSDHLYKIENIAIYPAQETIFITAAHSQIYECKMNELKDDEIRKKLNFKPLGQLIHIDEIVDIAVCSWRTIIMTASKDQTIRIWNYDTEKIELVKKYQVDITVVELNATGQFVAVAFSDQLRVMQIFMDDLNLIKTYNFPRCSSVKYSFLGHLMAAAYDNLVSITSVYNLDVIWTLKGHNGDVLSLAWSRDDKYLLSGGAEGAIYQWEAETGVRVQEIVQKGTEYRSLCCSADPFSIFSVTKSGYLREINNSEIVRELKAPEQRPFISLALAKSDLIMFATSDAGHLYSIQLPFLEAGGGTFTNYRFFEKPVTKVIFSNDGTLLLTGSQAGTLVIWVLQNIDGKVAPVDPYLQHGQEVIIPRNVLKEKNDQIANLELRIIQQAAEFQYQESQNEIFDSQQLADTHKGYCQALEALRTRNNILEQKHIEDLNEITVRINELKDIQRQQQQTLSDQFTEQILMIYEKQISFSKSSKEIEADYEEKLRTAAALLQDTVEALELDFKEKLEQREELIRGLLKELQDIKYENNEFCRQVETEYEENRTQNIVKNENYIKQEQEAEIMWRGEAGVLRRMCETASKEAERLLEELEVLNEERTKCQKTVAKLSREIEDLNKDLADREFAINVKENRIQEILHMNQQLEKYKQVLSHKITELKMQIEPRECEINEKRKQITLKEQQLDTLNEENTLIEAQLKKSEEQYLHAVRELKSQRRSAKHYRQMFDSLSTEIYNVAGKINDPDELSDGIYILIQKYASSEALLKHITLETQVKKEFERQRNHIESSIAFYRNEMKEKADSQKSVTLLKENMDLLRQIEKLRESNMESIRETGKLMTKLRLPNKNSAETQNKLTTTLAHIAFCKSEYQGEINTLMEQVKSLRSENKYMKE